MVIQIGYWLVPLLQDTLRTGRTRRREADSDSDSEIEFDSSTAARALLRWFERLGASRRAGKIALGSSPASKKRGHARGVGTLPYLNHSRPDPELFVP